MNEAWIMSVLGSARDEARAHAHYRLAEHLDDAMLIAASEYHVRLAAEGPGARHEERDRDAGGDAARSLLN
jgi:hypothetical protein